MESGGAKPAIAAEVSQLRSLAKDGLTHFGLTLPELLHQPARAAELIEHAGRSVGRSTIMTRARAVQKLAMLMLGDSEGRRWIAEFRSAMPKTKSHGWYDSGISISGSRNRVRPRSPTPDSGALEAILRIAVARSPVDGALAGLACFSGLELDEMCELRWRDVRWQDDADSTLCEVRVSRRGHLTTCLIVPMGAKPLLSLALVSGLQRDDYVFPGRADGDHISKGALRDRLRHLCESAGWPGLSRSQLTAAFTLWLGEHGQDDHSVKLILGRRRVATVDRLRRSSESIAAQLRVDGAPEAQAFDASL